MGVARLLAKGWIVFCLFAGAHAVHFALARGEAPLAALPALAVCVLLFGAMGLLFAGGFGATSNIGGAAPLARLTLGRLVPSFDEIVFLVFVVLSFVVQVLPLRAALAASILDPLQSTIFHIVPGQRALANGLLACKLGSDPVFSLSLASAIAWLLAAIYVASAASRIGLTAGLIRLERTLHPSAFGLTLLAALYGIFAIVGIQLLFVGSLYPWLGCGAYAGVTGALLTGLAPLFLAYLIVAALATLRASGPAVS